MSDKFFLIAILDGDDPKHWVPFPSSRKNLTAVNKQISAKLAKVRLPSECTIHVGLSMFSKDTLFDDSFQRVFSIVLDGTTLLADNLQTSDMPGRLELAIKKILKDNPHAKIFGVGIYALIETEDDEITQALQNRIDQIGRAACEGKLDVNPQVLPSFEAFAYQLDHERRRFTARQPLAALEIA